MVTAMTSFDNTLYLKYWACKLTNSNSTQVNSKTNLTKSWAGKGISSD